jgi:predicted enzyme related to lactoylglutathione lyase
MKVIDLAFVVYAVKDLAVARPFYEGTLRLIPAKTYLSPDGKQGMIEYDIGPATLAIGCGAPLFSPSAAGGVASLEVEDFDAAIAALRKDNVAIKFGPHETPVCWMAVVSDPDGNTIMLHRRKAG